MSGLASLAQSVRLVPPDKRLRLTLLLWGTFTAAAAVTAVVLWFRGMPLAFSLSLLSLVGLGFTLSALAAMRRRRSYPRR